MNDLLQDSFKPISGDAYVQNRKLVALIRETIAKLDNGPTLGSKALSASSDDFAEFVEGVANWLESEVSILVT